MPSNNQRLVVAIILIAAITLGIWFAAAQASLFASLTAPYGVEMSPGVEVTLSAAPEQPKAGDTVSLAISIQPHENAPDAGSRCNCPPRSPI